MPDSTAVRRAKRMPSIRVVSPDQMFEYTKPTLDGVARRAFEIFDLSGRTLGRDLDHWLQAEGELLHPVPVDIADAGGVLTVQAEVPGFRERDMQIAVEPERLTICGHRESTEDQKNEHTAQPQSGPDQFYRVIALPAAVSTTSSTVKATYEHGTLTITLLKRENAAERPIKLEPPSA